MNIETVLKKVQAETNEYVVTQKNKKERRNQLERDNETIKVQKADNSLEREILVKACSEARKLSSDLFSSISTNGLQTILGDNLSIEIVSGEKSGLPTLDFRVLANYQNGYSTNVDPSEEDGGGVADIVSMTNFITMNILNAEKNSSPLFLDEPTKYVSLGNADEVGSFLKQVSSDFDKQIIMITHAKDTAMHADKMITVNLDANGVSKVTEAGK